VTAAAEKIRSHIADLPQDSMRRRVLECARQFKASWVDLGRMLSEVKREALWREWGYASFETYCAKELFIRRQTAEKLTMSYGFLSRHEPSVVRAEERRAAPSFELIEVLSRAEAAGRLPENGWQELREDILDRPPSPAALNRRLSDRYGPAPRPEPGPLRPEEERLHRIAAMARRLAGACAAEEGVPRSVSERARALAEEIALLADG
jgi:hypothetical protein